MKTLMAVVASLLSACSTAPSVEPSVARSDLSRVTTPAPTTDVEAVAAGERAFGLALYRELAKESGNLFLSPYSVTVALALAKAWAREGPPSRRSTPRWA